MFLGRFVGWLLFVLKDQVTVEAVGLDGELGVGLVLGFGQ